MTHSQSDSPQSYEFFRKIGRAANARQSNTFLLHGNIRDLFCEVQYFDLPSYLKSRYAKDEISIVGYEQNKPISFQVKNLKHGGSLPHIRQLWCRWRMEVSENEKKEDLEKKFDKYLGNSFNDPQIALQLLRQISISQEKEKEHIIFLIEDADLILPAGDGDISRLTETDRRCIGIMQDWISDPGFLESNQSIILFSESRNLIHPKVALLPHVHPVEIPSPDGEERKRFILDFFSRRKSKEEIEEQSFQERIEELQLSTAGLTLYAIRGLLRKQDYEEKGSIPSGIDVFPYVEEFIKNQLGPDVVEFHKPSHRLDDVVAYSQLKKFLRDEFIPQCRDRSKNALSGAVVAGAIGVGKTFIFEATAAEMGMPVLILKNLRSQWYGQTDIIFERMKRALESIDKAMIFIDEADTVFGGVGKDVHETERRLTGKIQAMMSDTRLRGRIVWLLMTARPEMLSPDIRRPGRAGDLIIPILDPQKEDRKEFIKWMCSSSDCPEPSELEFSRLEEYTENFSAASFASVKKRIASSKLKGIKEILDICEDTLEADISSVRKYQELQALLNTTRKSLLPPLKEKGSEFLRRQGWIEELDKLKLKL